MSFDALVGRPSSTPCRSKQPKHTGDGQAVTLKSDAEEKRRGDLIRERPEEGSNLSSTVSLLSI